MREYYGSIWECDLFEMPGIQSLVPVQFLHNRAVSLVDKMNDTDPPLLFVIPCVEL